MMEWPGKSSVRYFSLLWLFIFGCQGPPAKDGPPPKGFGADEFPVEYALGSFDIRFNIPKSEFLQLVREAKEVWEVPAGRTLFRYDSTAEFRVNLIFDERQERTLEANRLKASIDSRGRSYDLLVRQHTILSGRLQESEKAYAAAVEEFNGKMERLNARIAGWNERGGAPEEEFDAMQREQEELRSAQGSLERRREQVDEEVRAVNDLVEQVNGIASESNFEVTLFNGRFVEGREFEQGVYTGREINIYQFTNRDELRIALVHEFGHALGFAHVDDPAAIMYYKFEKQDAGNLRLTGTDLSLLKEKFPAE